MASEQSKCSKDLKELNTKLNEVKQKGGDRLDDLKKNVITGLGDAGLTDTTVNKLINVIYSVNDIQINKAKERDNSLYLRDNEKKRHEAKTTTDKYINKLIIENKLTTNQLDTLLADYTGENIYTNNIQDLYNKYLREINKIKKSINDYINIVQTDSRKTFYENQELKFSGNVTFYLKVIYFGLLLYYIWFGGFLQQKLFKDYRVWIIIILYILVPFIIKYFVIYLFGIYKSVYDNYINTSDYDKKWFIKKREN